MVSYISFLFFSNKVQIQGGTEIIVHKRDEIFITGDIVNDLCSVNEKVMKVPYTCQLWLP